MTKKIEKGKKKKPAERKKMDNNNKINIQNWKEKLGD